VQRRFSVKYKASFFHFKQNESIVQKMLLYSCNQMLQIVCKKRQEELALTDKIHGPQTVFLKGISKYLKRNPCDIAYVDFQTLQTVLSKGQKSLCLHLQENDLVLKAKGRSFC